MAPTKKIKNQNKKEALPKACEKILLIMGKSRCTYWPLPKVNMAHQCLD
jgi:hypothetical protein